MAIRVELTNLNSEMLLGLLLGGGELLRFRHLLSLGLRRLWGTRLLGFRLMGIPHLYSAHAIILWAWEVSTLRVSLKTVVAYSL